LAALAAGGAPPRRGRRSRERLRGAAQRLPRTRPRLPGGLHPLVLARGEERCGTRGGAPGSPGTEPRLREDGVLVLAEHVLQLLRGVDDPPPSLPELMGRELGRVTRPLHAEPPSVESRLARRVIEPCARLSGSPCLRPPE